LSLGGVGERAGSRPLSRWVPTSQYMPKPATVSEMISTVPGSAAQSRMPDTRWATPPRRANTGMRPERWPKTSTSRIAVATPADAVAMNT
jgi:hypothetical protein